MSMPVPAPCPCPSSWKPSKTTAGAADKPPPPLEPNKKPARFPGRAFLLATFSKQSHASCYRGVFAPCFAGEKGAVRRGHSAETIQVMVPMRSGILTSFRLGSPCEHGYSLRSALRGRTTCVTPLRYVPTECSGYLLAPNSTIWKAFPFFKKPGTILSFFFLPSVACSL